MHNGGSCPRGEIMHADFRDTYIKRIKGKTLVILALKKAKAILV
jgi:hypothetical protein